MSYDAFNKAILNSLNLGCDSYIVYDSSVQAFLESFELNLQLASRQNSFRKFIFVFTYIDIDPVMINNLLKSDVLTYIPDFIIIYPVDLFTESDSILMNNLTSGVASYKIITREMDDPTLVSLDYWYSANRSFLFNTNLFPFKVKNLNKNPLTVLAMPTMSPYIIIEKDVIVYPNKKPETIVDGIEIGMFREYANRYNITLNFTIERSKKWGFIFDNGTFTGFMKTLLVDKFDSGIGCLMYFDKLQKYTTFASSIMHIRVICIVPSPRIMQKFNLVFLPFTFTLWISVLFTITMLSITFTYLRDKSEESQSRYQPTVSTENISRIPSKNAIMDLPKSFYDIYRITLNQPKAKNTKNRTILTIVSLHGLLICSAYTSGLSAILTLPQYEKLIETRQDLIDSKMEWGSNDFSELETIAHSNNSQTIELLKTFREYSNEELQNLPPRSFAFLIDALDDGTLSIPDYVPKHVIPHSQLMKESIFADDVEAIFRKSSPFLPGYNDLLSKFRESGVAYKFKTDINHKYLNISEQLNLLEKVNMHKYNNNPVVLNIFDLESIFLIWSCGLMLSCFCFGLEKYWYKMERN